MSEYYLKPTIKAEPLIWRWYAWSYLIPPLTAGCNIVERHLKIMQSYVDNPELHALAVKDPKLIGGPFIDLDGQKVEEVKELIKVTLNDCEKLIELHNAYKEMDILLQNEKGASLEQLYKKIPTLLRGFIELVYDLNNYPSIRLIEPFIYNSYYDDRFQEISLSNTIGDYRKFLLSTPRLDSTPLLTPKLDQEDEVYLKLPFSDKRLDILFSLKQQPGDLKTINNLFDIPENKRKLFESFFTNTPPLMNNDRNYFGEDIRLRYFGHACMLVQTKSTSILFDPVISYTIENDIPRYTFEDLPDHIDYVIITHNHQDHLMLETLLQLRHKIGNIVFPSNLKGSLADPSIQEIMSRVGFSGLIELGEMETLPIQDGFIMGLPFLGEHCDLNIQSKLSYFINLKGKKLLFAADSNNIDEYLYKNIFDITSEIDMLFLGMECEGGPLTWLYGPLLTKPIARAFDRSRTLSGSNFEKAWSIVNNLKCKNAYVYAMGQEPWLRHVMALNYTPDSIQITESNKFVTKCRENGIEAERLYGKKEWIFSLA
jgi:L-ascorbate metabolism protein UlaG (beta-lactamase superfamily)